MASAARKAEGTLDPASREPVPAWTDPDPKALCEALICADEQPELLLAAERCLRRGWSEVQPPAEMMNTENDLLTPASWPTIRRASSPAVSPPRDPAPTVGWLLEEPLVLRRISPPADSESPIHALLFGIYDHWRTAKRPPSTNVHGWSRPWNRFSEPTLSRARSARVEAAAIRVSLSCFPATRLPEILGYLHAALESLATLPPSGATAKSTGLAQADDAEFSSDVAALSGEQPVCRRALQWLLQDPDPEAAQSLRSRVAFGMALQRSLLAHVEMAECALDREPTQPAAALAEVLRRKAGYAVGYHADVLLAGKSLDFWFAEEPFDAAAFIDALGGSEWVDPSHPERSRVLKLLDFGGPMFGIFTDPERAAVRAWLDSLADAHSSRVDDTHNPSPTRSDRTGPTALTTTPGVCSPAWKESTAPHSGSGLDLLPCRKAADSVLLESVPAGNRRLYHLLLNIEQYPERLIDIQRHAERCLARTSGYWFGGRPPFQYSEQAFQTWLGARYRRQLKSLRSRRDRPALSREAYRFGIEQLAPAILVDGCWLQRSEQLHDESPEVARRLMAIYADELGRGVLEQNHPYVYRRLLRSLAIDLPATASAEFARRRGFLGSSFDLPAYLLAIGLFPHRFLPELLGLNLAIELSGLGASYSRIARELDYWGIDARIVRLHQSIDNLASGHAALAKECVMIHLDQVRALGGEPSVVQHWRRIWTGYRSLAAVTRRFRWQLVMRYGVMAGAETMGRLFSSRTRRGSAL